MKELVGMLVCGLIFLCVGVAIGIGIGVGMGEQQMKARAIRAGVAEYGHNIQTGEPLFRWRYDHVGRIRYWPEPLKE